MGLDCKILDLISSSAGKAAPYMTRGLREIGNGSMAEGISAIRDYSIKYGMELGEKTGIKKGLGLGICTMGVLWCATKILEDFRKYKIEQIEALRVVEQQIKNTDTKFESIQTNEETSFCKKKAEYEDREEVVT